MSYQSPGPNEWRAFPKLRTSAFRDPEERREIQKINEWGTRDNVAPDPATQNTTIALNTTHRTSDGKDHSDVVLNNTHRTSNGNDHSNVVLNSLHRSSDGSDHSYINQDVTMTANVQFNALLLLSSLTSRGGRVVDTTRVTGTYTILVTDHNVFCDTDGGAFTATLPAGAAGQNIKVVNCGTSGNNLTLAPSGLELLQGANSSITLTDGQTVNLVYEATEGWY